MRAGTRSTKWANCGDSTRPLAATAHEDGTEMVTVNPLRKAQLDGAEQRVVYLNERFAAFAELLSGEFIKQVDKRQRKDHRSRRSREAVR